jgi:hypothetical protein
MKRPQLSALAVTLTLASSGCATIVQGTHEDVEIRTRPPKAQILIDGVPQGESPTKVSMDVSASHVVVIRAPGYKEQTIRTDRMLSGGFVAIDILLALIPVIVDAATGAWYHIQPTPMNVMLTPEDGDVAASPAPATAAATNAPGAAR